MADLMSGSFNYSALEVQYDHFSVPAAKIKVNGMDIIGTLKLSVSQIQVDLTAKEASSVNFTIDNVFSLDTRSFAKTVSSVVRLGSVVTVELGYGSSYTAVFKGYIAEISYDYSDAPGISVTALDVMRLLMENSRINYRYTEKTYTAVVKTVLAKYLTLCSDLRNVETTTEQLEGITQNGTDYDFLKKIAKKANKEFFIFSGAAYFRTPGKNNTAVMTLEWGKNLMEFRMSNTYCHERITVQGIDAQKRYRQSGGCRVFADVSFGESGAENRSGYCGKSKKAGGEHEAGKGTAGPQRIRKLHRTATAGSRPVYLCERA